MPMNRVFPLAALLLAGCVTTEPGVRPDDASATDHRLKAEQHRKIARQHQEQFDPAATTSVDLPLAPGGTWQAREIPATIERFRNPTAGHLRHADAHLEHARQHAAAATVLEQIEEVACAGVEHRDVCPLAGTIRAVRTTEKGVVLTATGEPDELLGAVRCHLAAARTQHHEGMIGCPLFLKTIEATVTESGEIALESSDPGTVEALQLSFEP